MKEKPSQNKPKVKIRLLQCVESIGFAAMYDTRYCEQQIRIRKRSTRNLRINMRIYVEGVNMDMD